MATEVLRGSMTEMLAKVKEKTMTSQEIYEIDMKIWKIMSGMNQRTIQQIIAHFFRTEGGRAEVDPEIVKNRIVELKNQGVLEVKPCKGFTEYVLVKGMVPKKPVDDPAPKVAVVRDFDKVQPFSNATNVFAMRDHHSTSAHTDLPPDLDENFEIKEDTLVTPTTEVSKDTTPTIKEESVDMKTTTTTTNLKPKMYDTVPVHFWKLLANGNTPKLSEVLKSLMDVRRVIGSTAMQYVYNMSRKHSWIKIDKSQADWIFSMEPQVPMPENPTTGRGSTLKRQMLAQEAAETEQVVEEVIPTQETKEHKENKEAAPLIEVTLKIKGMVFTISEMKELHEALLSSNLSEDKNKQGSSLLQTAHLIKGVSFSNQELWEVLETLDKNI